MCTMMHLQNYVEALSIETKDYEQPKCPLTGN